MKRLVPWMGNPGPPGQTLQPQKIRHVAHACTPRCERGAPGAPTAGGLAAGGPRLGAHRDPGRRAELLTLPKGAQAGLGTAETEFTQSSAERGTAASLQSSSLVLRRGQQRENQPLPKPEQAALGTGER